MKIVVIARSLTTHARRSMESMTESLLGEWATRHEVICITTPYPGGRSLGVHSRSYEVVQVPGKPGAYTRQWLRSAARAAELLKPDIVVGVSAGAHGFRRNRIRNFPIVMQAHGTIPLEIRRSLSTGGIRGILRAVRVARGLTSDLQKYRRYDTIIAISSVVAESLGRFPVGKHG